jgi:glutamate formiminotransferase / 5-formyltetrahydrofolate cyclo-ligase
VTASRHRPVADLECVVNISEGRDRSLVHRLASACETSLLDVHSDPDHQRSVFTLAGPAAVVESDTRVLAETALSVLDFTAHDGRHPSFGVVDVVPFVPLRAGARPASGGHDLQGPPPHLAPTPPLDDAVAARDRFAKWAGSQLGLACHLYGPLRPAGHRTLPEIRKTAGRSLTPDTGPALPVPRAGRCAVGARHFLVAYNLWVAGGGLELARAVATDIRGPAVRALGLDLAGRPQISCNLVDPSTVGPAEVHDEVARRLEQVGASVERSELVGLVPAAVLEAVPSRRWDELDLADTRTVEARLEEAGLTWS